MVSQSKIIRKFERFMMSLGQDIHETPDDRKNTQDIIKYPISNFPYEPKEGDIFLGTIHDDFENKTETYIPNKKDKIERMDL